SHWRTPPTLLRILSDARSPRLPGLALFQHRGGRPGWGVHGVLGAAGGHSQRRDAPAKGAPYRGNCPRRRYRESANRVLRPWEFGGLLRRCLSVAVGPAEHGPLCHGRNAVPRRVSLHLEVPRTCDHKESRTGLRRRPGSPPAACTRGGRLVGGHQRLLPVELRDTRVRGWTAERQFSHERRRLHERTELSSPTLQRREGLRLPDAGWPGPRR